MSKRDEARRKRYEKALESFQEPENNGETPEVTITIEPFGFVVKTNGVESELVAFAESNNPVYEIRS